MMANSRICKNCGQPPGEHYIQVRQVREGQRHLLANLCLRCASQRGIIAFKDLGEDDVEHLQKKRLGFPVERRALS